MFPLPLTCLEEYMLCDDRPSHPMTGVLRLRFSGALNRTAWEAALAVTVQRHVLLRSTVESGGRRRLHWVDHPGWCPAVAWQAAVNPYGLPPMSYLDLRQQPGTRVWVVDGREGHEAVFQVHHACSDGLGLARMLEDLLISYAQQLGAQDPGPALAEVDDRSFRQRGAPGLSAWSLFRMAHHQAVGLLGAREFLSRSPAPLVPPAPAVDEAIPPPAFPCPLTQTLEPDETRRLIQAAKSLGVTVNDLLARDMFLAVTAWRRARGFGGDLDWLRFSVPINLRRAEDERMPVANSVSSVFLDRRPADCADPQQLLDGIQRQMQIIKRHQLGYTFVLSLALARLLPGGMATRTRADKCQITGYFSNLGVVLGRVPLPRRDGRLVCGNVVLESVDFVIPRRPYVDAAFCVYTYAGRLHVLLHFDPRVLSEEASRHLLLTFVQGIRRSAQIST